MNESGGQAEKKQSRTQAIRFETGRLALVVLGMFAFGYALIPLYNVFCEITGLNGKTGVIDSAQAATVEVDESRLITVEFVTAVNAGGAWEFYPLEKKIQVHPGEVRKTLFRAENRSEKLLTGQAVPSVMPGVASKFFNKTECFCFTEQLFNPGEAKDMPVAFMIDPRLPERVSTVSLSYTFFDVTKTASIR